jgi:uncharacterized protein (TIGR02594 family)
MSEPAWLVEARKHVGLREVPGKTHAPVIQRWLRQFGAWWVDDETPWCGTFVAACLEAAGVRRPRNWFRALAWLDFGTPILAPRVGCVVVFSREGGGHVGFLVGQDEEGRLMVLGGNQGNAVSVAPFERFRVRGYRWPSSVPAPAAGLPLLASNGAVSSRSES